MKSMTGYGRASSTSAQADLEVTVRSVNSRFLETRLGIPPELHSVESEIKSEVGRFFDRGRVELTVWRRSGPKASVSGVRLNHDLAKTYLAEFKKLGTKLKIPTKIGIETLIRQPGVVVMDQASEISPDEKDQLFKAIREALKNCEEERLREGKVLEKELTRLLKELDDKTSQMEDLRERANQNLEERFRSRLAQLGFTGEAADSRLWQEVSLQVEKSDIREEIVRLREHIKAYSNLLRGKEAQGKKMDFYTQELLRETNTIGSKSQVSELTQLVVESKALIERLREQIQNIE